MKYLFVFLMACTCVPALASVPADAEPLITRSQLDGHQLSLTLANLEQQTTRVEITNLDTDVRHFREVVNRHNGYRVAFDLDQLEQGRYVIAVKKGDTLRQQVILVTDTGIMCSDWK